MNKRTTISMEAKLGVLTESGYRCAVPTCPNELTVALHHIIEVHKGGGNEQTNLLPLCPYCHDKYHRGIIDKKSIVEWKTRIQNMYRSATRQPPKQIPSAHTQDYAQAFAQYTCRTFPIWYLYDYQNRLKCHLVGYATYISTQTLITSRVVLARIDSFRKQIPKGQAVLRLGSKVLDFQVEEIHTWAGIVFMKSRPVEERRLPLLDVAPKDSDNDFVPDETPIQQIAQVPFVGQEVGFLYGSSEADDRYPFWCFAFGVSVVSNFLATDPMSLDRYELEAIAGQVDYLGGPVFLRDGTLVGVLTTLHPGERTYGDSSKQRLIFGGFFGVPRLRNYNQSSSH